MTRPSIDERFWAKVLIGDGCWIWTAHRAGNGYGRFSIRRGTSRSMPAHHYSFGATVPIGQVLLHSCDTPACVRPSHLTLGTQLQNIADRDAKGRNARGERHARAKITDAQAAEVVALRAAGLPFDQIAPRFGISESHACRIANGKRRQ